MPGELEDHRDQRRERIEGDVLQDADLRLQVELCKGQHTRSMLKVKYSELAPGPATIQDKHFKRLALLAPWVGVFTSEDRKRQRKLFKAKERIGGGCPASFCFLLRLTDLGRDMRHGFNKNKHSKQKPCHLHLGKNENSIPK